MTLIVAEARPLPAAESLGDDGRESAQDGAIPGAEDGQIDLFAPRVVLARELESALGRGLFEEAARIRRILEESYGPSLHTRDLGFLDRLGGRLWKGPPGRALTVWAEIDVRLCERAHLRDRVREAVFLRLLATHLPEALITARPECLPALARVLASNTRMSPEDGRRRARILVRDALLAGRGLTALGFDHDKPLADLLAEHFPPRWLACLGLIRRLWSAPPHDEGALDAFSVPPVEVRSDDEAALDFWRCLRVAETPDCPENRLHEARRRMKRLRPEFHALYMRRAAVRS